jgi:uracil-DNA glycosylase
MGNSPNWSHTLSELKSKASFRNALSLSIREREKGKKIFPDANDVFTAFELTPFDQIKVVILGQDPYHGVGQAQGLAFSVPNGILLPPSLKNIFKELHTNFYKGQTSSPFLERITNKQGDLTSWAKHGVFLLNSVLTVEEGKPASHSKIGWSEFTDSVIGKISDEKEGVIFLLWGNFAKQKVTLIDTTKHTVLLAAHPSPLSAYNGFFGCGHFKKVNEILKGKGKKEIEWWK